MPATVKVKVIAGRDLPVMDRASEMADPFVEIKFGQTTYKTDVYQKSLNPFWDSDWYTFEVDDDEIHGDCVQFRVMDYDMYSANDAIGRVYLDLSSILWKRSESIKVGGWFPIYDTMHGIRGELNVCVKVNVFADVNKYRGSLGGFEVFSSPVVPQGYDLISIFGFVDALIASSDPEYQWIDKIRTPRASNEARQALFSRLSGSVVRKISEKVCYLGGNAVVGFSHHFDLESGTGIVVRGTGTAVTLHKPICVSLPALNLTLSALNVKNDDDQDHDESSGFDAKSIGCDTVGCDKADRKPCSKSIDYSYCTLNTMMEKSIQAEGTAHCLATEFPFITMQTVPAGIIRSIGGFVSAKSVKLLKNLESQDEDEIRLNWWREIRLEIRANMKVLNCNAVVGYSETSSIFEDLCILNAIGTAIVLDLGEFAKESSAETRPGRNSRTGQEGKSIAARLTLNRLARQSTCSEYSNPSASFCRIVHVPYSETSLPFPIRLDLCQICAGHAVPDILLCSMDLPTEIDLSIDFCLIQCRVVRSKHSSNGESLAKDISVMLPFVEHELHGKLVRKLKSMGKNAVFGLKTTVTVGDYHLIAVATGTAFYLNALPTFASKENQSPTDIVDESAPNSKLISKEFPLVANDSFGGESKSRRLRLFSERNHVILDLDSALEVGERVVDPLKLPSDFYCCNTSHTISGYSNTTATVIPKNQHFIRVARFNIYDSDALTNETLSKKMDFLIKSTLYKFRRCKPVCLSNLDFTLGFFAGDLQIALRGTVHYTTTMTSSDGEANRRTPSRRLSATLPSTNADGDATESSPLDAARTAYGRRRCLSSVAETWAAASSGRRAFITSSHRALANAIQSPPTDHSNSVAYLGRYDFFFIRETNSLREMGGLDSFLHTTLAEIFHVVQSHVAALGGHGLTSFQCLKSEVVESAGRNQAQCLIAVAGDVIAFA